MKKLLLLTIIFLATAHAKGDFGEGGGPKIVKAYIRNSEMALYKDRIEYASLLDDLAFKSVDQKSEAIDYEKLLRFNLLRSQYINNPRKLAENINDGETFIIDRSKVSSKEFGLLELKSVIKFYTKSGRKIDSSDICVYFVNVNKSQRVVAFSNLIQLNLCGQNSVPVGAREISKVRVEFRKK